MKRAKDYTYRQTPFSWPKVALGDDGLKVNLLIEFGQFPDCEPTQRLPIPAQLISPEPARSGLHR